MRELPDAALAYAARGWRVFPVYGISADGTCTCAREHCGDAGKHPRTRHGVHDATTDTARIERWWTKWPHANIGIATGNGLIVLDVDGARGRETISALQREHGVLQLTYAVRSGRNDGGMHYYYTTAPKVTVPSRVLGAGVDLKGEGGYVVAPPSLHATGNYYTVVADLPLADTPAWLIGGRRQRMRLPVPTRLAGIAIRNGIHRGFLSASGSQIGTRSSPSTLAGCAAADSTRTNPRRVARGDA